MGVGARVAHSHQAELGLRHAGIQERQCDTDQRLVTHCAGSEHGTRQLGGDAGIAAEVERHALVGKPEALNVAGGIGTVGTAAGVDDRQDSTLHRVVVIREVAAVHSRVDASATVDGVVAAATFNGVVASAADDHVVQPIADQDVTVRRTREVLDIAIDVDGDLTCSRDVARARRTGKSPCSLLQRNGHALGTCARVDGVGALGVPDKVGLGFVVHIGVVAGSSRLTWAVHVLQGSDIEIAVGGAVVGIVDGSRWQLLRHLGCRQVVVGRGEHRKIILGVLESESVADLMDIHARRVGAVCRRQIVRRRIRQKDVAARRVGKWQTGVARALVLAGIDKRNVVARVA